MAKITATPPESLCPTQITVGMIEVRDKQQQLAALKPADQEELLRAHPMPAVVGPRGKLYITDHHHLVWADFFRRNVAVEIVTGDFGAAVRAALPLAKSDRKSVV